MTNSSNPLIDIGQLTEPITKLIETVSDGIRVLYEPTRIRRKAEADADATIIQAKAQLVIDELNLRAAQRREKQELRRQKNTEAIVEPATKELPERVSSEKVDDDCIVQFLNFSQDVSNEEIQSLWARILAGEITKLGSFSLRTLNIVRTLSQKVAILFQRFVNYVVNVDEILMHSYDDDIESLLKQKGLGYNKLTHLTNLGLTSALPSWGSHINAGAQVEIGYFENHYRIIDKGTERAVIGTRNLTDVGLQLFRLCTFEPDNDYRDLLIKCLSNEGLEVELLPAGH